MAICDCPDTHEHRISCDNHPRNKTDVSTNAFRVLVKTMYGRGVDGVGSETETRYYFVKTQDSARAIQVVDSVHVVRSGSNEPTPKIKYDVEPATKLEPPHGEEIYSL